VLPLVCEPPAVSAHRWGRDECLDAIKLIHHLAEEENYWFHSRARQGLHELGHNEDDVAECLCTFGLDDVDFSADKRDRDRPDKRVLVLRYRTGDEQLYVKMSFRPTGAPELVVLSYKPWVNS